MYEAFMRRAYQTIERNHAKGIDNSVYRQLYFVKSGHSLTVKSYDKQLDKVKGYLLKGVGKVLKWKLTAEERAQVEYQARILENRADEEDVYQAIVELLDSTQRFKEFVPAR